MGAAYKTAYSTISAGLMLGIASVAPWAWVLLWLVAAYMIGAIPFGLILGYLIAGVDIRQHGSGNIGATNLGRVIGWQYFPLALFLDFAKGAVPVAAWFIYTGEWAIAPYSDFTCTWENFGRRDIAALIGLTALAGHLWPIYLGFRGGKGVATGAGVVSVLMPVPTLIAAMVWGIVAWMTRYVSLSSLVAAATLVVAQLMYTWPSSFDQQHRAASLLAILGAALIFWRHRDNLVRLWQGRESKLGQRSPQTTNAGTKHSAGTAPSPTCSPGGNA